MIPTLSLAVPAAAALYRPSKGAHVAVPRARIAHTNAIPLTSPPDGRVMFVLPWGDLSYIGTTETDDAGPPPTLPDATYASLADVVYLLRSANALFPNARLAPPDVRSTWAGLRPLLAPDKDLSASQVSREHRVVESASGLITIAGGKLTTYRVMARDVADRVGQRLRALDGRPLPPRARTDALVLPGGETADLEGLVKAAKQRGVSDATAQHLVAKYGSESAAVLNLVDHDRALGAAILAGRPEIWAEVTHAVEREMALRLSDVLIRRLHLFYEAPGQAAAAAVSVSERLAALLGWDATRRAEEVADYQREVERSRAYLKDVAGTRRITA